MREAILNVFHTSGARIFSLIVGMITLSITARWLGPEGRGILAGATTWVALFSTFGGLSLGQVALHLAARERENQWLGSTLGSLLIIAVVMTIFGWVVAAILYSFSRGALFNQISPLILIVAFLTLPLILWEQYGSSLLMAVNRLNVYNNAQLVARTFNVPLLIAALYAGAGLVGVLIVSGICQAMVSFAGLRKLVQLADFQIGPSKQRITELLSGGLKLHLNAIGSFMLMSASVLIVNYYRGPEETGYYQLALQLIGVAMIVPQSVSMVMYAKIAQLGPDAAWEYHRKLLAWTCLGMVGASIGAWVVAPVFVPLLVGDKFGPAIAAFQWLLPCLLGMTFSTIMAAQWIGRGWFIQAAGLTMLVGCLNLVSSLMLVPKYGMYGAIIGALVTYIVSIFVNGGVALWCEKRFKRL